MAVIEKRKPSSASTRPATTRACCTRVSTTHQDTLKARLCRKGKVELERFADEHGIPYRHCGKLVVALDEMEIPRLMALKERAVAKGVEGLEEVGPERIRELEPHVSGIRGLWSPRTGIIDFRRVALAYADEVRARGGTVIKGTRVLAVRDTPSERVVISSAGRFRARGVIACAGLHADRLARRSGVRTGREWCRSAAITTRSCRRLGSWSTASSTRCQILDFRSSAFISRDG